MISMKWFFGVKEDLSDVHVVRREVFVEEQGVPEDKVDNGTDAECIHLVVYDDSEKPVSTGRVHITDEDFIIGRVATIKSHRGQGLATGIMQALIEACVQMGGERQITNSQVRSMGFYEKLGFTPYSSEFEEAGIPHVSMEHFGSVKKCGSGGHCGGCGKGH